MSDEYIRKQDVKDALQEKVFHNLTDEFYGAMQVLDELEPADVVPVVHGEWTKLSYDGFNCNECGSTFVIMQGRENMHFCPNCGAKMDEYEEE